QDEALPAKFQAAGAVHNGFLGTLVEVGLLGAIPLFWFMAIGLKKLWLAAKPGQPGSQLGISYVLGYCASSLVEPRLLNLAHPASVIAWCFLISGGFMAQQAISRTRVPMHPALAHPPTEPSRPGPRDWAVLRRSSQNSRDWAQVLK